MSTIRHHIARRATSSLKGDAARGFVRLSLCAVGVVMFGVLLSFSWGTQPLEYQNEQARVDLLDFEEMVVARFGQGELPYGLQSVARLLGVDDVKAPWGRSYMYRRLGPGSFMLSSHGPDGRMGSQDDVKVSQ